MKDFFYFVRALWHLDRNIKVLMQQSKKASDTVQGLNDCCKNLNESLREIIALEYFKQIKDQ